MRSIIFQACLVLTVLSGVVSAQVKLGIDVLRDEHFKLLEGKRVGLVANPSSVDSHLVPTIDVIRAASNVKLVALYAPEHGIYGDIYAGGAVKDRTDERTGLPVYSVYGKTRRPTTQMLKPIDTLVFDLQDIGSRSYTFISSMKACMQSCAEHDVEMIVLDRPNPLGGVRIEGPLLEKKFESFIGYVYVPYVHGMTMGELARLVQQTELPKYSKLRVVNMQGWKREMLWEETGLGWVPTSPHIPTPETCAYYAATGFLGELGQLSNGCGYTTPFELAGAPWVNGDNLARSLNQHYNAPGVVYSALAKKRSPMNLKPAAPPDGIFFRGLRYKPFYAKFKDEPCQGVQVHIDPRTTGNLVEVNFRLLEALGARELINNASRKQHRSFDITCGSDEPRKYLSEMRDLSELFEKWKSQCEQFRDKRMAYLLYK